MDVNSREITQLLELASWGDHASLQKLFALHSEQLSRMIALRMDRRLTARIDVSDIIQEVHIEVWRCLPHYMQNSAQPFYFWLRGIAANKLLELHRFHLGTKMRDARREVQRRSTHSLESTTDALVYSREQLLEAPSEIVIQQELAVQLIQAIDQMNSLDREVLILRFYKQLSPADTAAALAISKQAASMRCRRALKRLKFRLKSGP